MQDSIPLNFKLSKAVAGADLGGWIGWLAKPPPPFVVHAAIFNNFATIVLYCIIKLYGINGQTCLTISKFICNFQHHYFLAKLN